MEEWNGMEWEEDVVCRNERLAAVFKGRSGVLARAMCGGRDVGRGCDPGSNGVGVVVLLSRLLLPVPVIAVRS